MTATLVIQETAKTVRQFCLFPLINNQRSPIFLDWIEEEPWSPCSVSCGVGWRSRVRTTCQTLDINCQTDIVFAICNLRTCDGSEFQFVKKCIFRNQHLFSDQAMKKACNVQTLAPTTTTSLPPDSGENLYSISSAISIPEYPADSLTTESIFEENGCLKSRSKVHLAVEGKERK